MSENNINGNKTLTYLLMAVVHEVSFCWRRDASMNGAAYDATWYSDVTLEVNAKWRLQICREILAHALLASEA